MAAGLFYSKQSGSFKMKTIFLFMLFTLSLFGSNLNESLLKVHATLVPKIYLMDYDFTKKLVDNTITIAILYKKNDYQSAKDLQILMKNRYKKGIKSYKVHPVLVSYADVGKTQANIYYLFPSSKKLIQKVVKRASLNNALTFSYQRDDLQYGVMISLNISKKVKPLLNLEAIRAHSISLRPVLIDISTIFTNDLGSNTKKLQIRNFFNTKRYWA